MDGFVQGVLTAWGFRNYIEKFKEKKVDMNKLLCLTDENISELFEGDPEMERKFKEKLKTLKEDQNATDQVQANRNTSRNVKRKSKGESRSMPESKRQRATTNPEEESALSPVKRIIKNVKKSLDKQKKTELTSFLQNKINKLKTEKRELVGVFGRTGAGKSSLINAVIGEKDLLPSGKLSACTTVMIKVEANTKNQNYEAEIEFITEEEFKNDFWYCKEFYQNNKDTGEGNEEKNEDDGEHEDDNDDDDDDDDDDVDLEDAGRLPALYGKDWERVRALEDPWKDKKSQKFRKLIESEKTSLSLKSAEELSEELKQYTKRGPENGDGEDEKKWLWPLVKCVTVKVPNNDLLQHVTLVDLPGAGDCNKIRDNMWKEVVGDCSIMWIASIFDRAADDKDTWNILKNICRLMGNGGQCKKILFICTKSDIDYDKDMNKQAKDLVMNKFIRLNQVMKHFSRECFEVFTVSAKEFLEKTKLEPENTEIPQLQEFLKKLNDSHSETFDYVSGAKGILSLIQGAKIGGVGKKSEEVVRYLELKLKHEQQKLSTSMERIHKVFENCLNRGVKKSMQSYKQALKDFLKPKKSKGSAFHKTLKHAVKNRGIYKTKSGIQKNLNVILSRWLTESIDKEFRRTFPNESKPLDGAITSFSLGTERLAEKYKDMQLQLEYLGTEEKKLKTELNKTIQEHKKKIYNSLLEKIEDTMQPCYDAAKEHEGTGSLQRMRVTIKEHVEDVKDSMFEEAKNVMLSKLDELKEEILEKLDMTDSFRLSLTTDHSLPDVREKLETVTQFYNQLKESTDESTSADRTDLAGP